MESSKKIQIKIIEDENIDKINEEKILVGKQINEYDEIITKIRNFIRKIDMENENENELNDKGRTGVRSVNVEIQTENVEKFNIGTQTENTENINNKGIQNKVNNKRKRKVENNIDNNEDRMSKKLKILIEELVNETEKIGQEMEIEINDISELYKKAEEEESKGNRKSIKRWCNYIIEYDNRVDREVEETGELERDIRKKLNKEVAERRKNSLQTVKNRISEARIVNKLFEEIGYEKIERIKSFKCREIAGIIRKNEEILKKQIKLRENINEIVIIKKDVVE